MNKINNKSGRTTKYSNVKMSKQAKADLDEIAKSFGLGLGETLEAMIAYFKLIKQNPMTQKSQMNELENFKEEMQEGVIARSRETIDTFLKKQKEEQSKALNEVLEKVEAREKMFACQKALDLWNNLRKEPTMNTLITKATLDKYQKAFEMLEKKVEQSFDFFNQNTGK